MSLSLATNQHLNEPQLFLDSLRAATSDIEHETPIHTVISTCDHVSGAFGNAVWNILATDVQFGPDGAIHVCDWVNRWEGEGKGRIDHFIAKEHSNN
jgi:hypothetical protein